jgi:tetratricopeptide (TPR) repeat protein
MAPELLEGDPATPRSDLFAAGVMIAECMEVGGAHDRALGELVERLTEPEPSRRPESASAALLILRQPDARTDQATLVASPERTRQVDLRAALPALGAIAAVLVAVVVIVLVSVGGDGPERAGEPSAAQNPPAQAPDERGDEAPERGGEPAERGGGDQGQGGSGEPASGPPDPALGAQLNQQGYDLMNAGNYEEAIPVLRDAVDAFGSQTSDLNYAYALYNLGRSLRLAGRPDEAVPLLRERLQIRNQTGIVRRELEAAIAASDG